jgi:hypothetical protein
MKSMMVVCVALFLLTGCSSSRITHSWKSDISPAKKYNRIMVVGIMPENVRNLREKMENHFVGDLTERGFTAISSSNAYGPKSFENITEKGALAKLSSSEVDAVITIVLLDKKRERYYVPGRVYYSPYNMCQRRFWGYYTTIYDRIYSPGYYEENTKYFWERNFYDMESKELLYSVQTESFDPNSAESLAHEYGLIILNDMAKQGIIKE